MNNEGLFTRGQCISVVLSQCEPCDTEAIGWRVRRIKLKVLVLHHTKHEIGLLLYQLTEPPTTAIRRLVCTFDSTRLFVRAQLQRGVVSEILYHGNISPQNRILFGAMEQCPRFYSSVQYIDYETARKATLAFLLVAKFLPLHKDIIPKIAHLVYIPLRRELNFLHQNE
jgi:hypothetical protein